MSLHISDNEKRQKMKKNRKSLIRPPKHLLIEIILYNQIYFYLKIYFARD